MSAHKTVNAAALSSPPEIKSALPDGVDEPEYIEPLPEGAASGQHGEFETTEWDVASADSSSAASSVYRHEYEHGRRYHAYKNGRYPIPNDDHEQQREHMKHATMLELTDGLLFDAPIGKKPGKILDLGTGTGIWAMSVADMFPEAEVLGIDLSPIQPSWVPSNLRFVIDDFEDEWTYGGHWDFIHLRYTLGSLQNIPAMLDRIRTHLRPGGWVEFQEIHGDPQCDDGTMADDDMMAQYYRLGAEAMSKFGLDITQVRSLGERLQKAGFVDVRCVVRKLPLGPWARDPRLRLIGQYSRVTAVDSIDMAIHKPFIALGMSEEERHAWAARTRESILDDKPHRYYQHYFWYAQRPTS